MLSWGQGGVEVPQMSATTPAIETESKESRLKNYLTQRAADGEVYFKSKFIADEVGLSAKEIGALMVKLRESATDLEIEKWSYTSATTWRVTRA
jgi:CRP-like cAMP-binding protein